MCETFYNVSSGILPKRIIFGMVEATAAQGSYTKNPGDRLKATDQNSVTVDNHDVPKLQFYSDFIKKPNFIDLKLNSEFMAEKMIDIENMNN